MPTTPEAPALTAYIELHLPPYLEEVSHRCAMECPTSAKSGVDEAGAWVQRWVATRGWELHVWPDETVGDSLAATLRGPRRLAIMLAAHLDTVYPVGIAAQRPVRVEGDTLLGPGCADNKS